MAPKKKGAAKAEPKAKAEAEPKEEETKKRKAEEEKAAPQVEPPKKEARKVEEPAEAAAEVEEEAGEREKDQEPDKRPTIKESVAFDTSETTLNVVPTTGGRILASLSDGGMQYLVAGARANVGVKAGRHLYEVRVLETMSPSVPQNQYGGKGREPAQKQLVRVGFSTAGSPLFLGDTAESLCFDAEGFFMTGGKKVSTASRFTKDQILGVLLNLDPASKNANTISLFRNGERVAEPQALPEGLVGQTLFPHVSFRCCTLQVHFGPQLLKELPFKCKALGCAAKADAVVTPSSVPADGKYEVVFPVAFPGEGTFDWLDSFLKENPKFTELSDRKLHEWAAQSGLFKPRGTSRLNSNDKPDFNYQLPAMDDLSVRKIIGAIAPVLPRHFVVMEVKDNLMEEGRKEHLKKFNAPHFKRVAQVVMGEPPAAYKKSFHDSLLKQKQEKAVEAWKAKKVENERKKQIAARQKQLLEMRKQADEARKKAIEEAKKRTEEMQRKAKEQKEKAEKAAADKAAAEAAGTAEHAEAVTVGEAKPEEEAAKVEGESGDVEMKAEDEKGDEKDCDQAKPAEGGDTEMKEEEKKEEVKEEEKKEEKKEEEPEEEDLEPPTVELTEEETNMWFKPPLQGMVDIAPVALSQSFGLFTIPGESEGFDEVKFEWQNAAKSKEYLKKWVLGKKLTSTIEDLQPGDLFKTKQKEWATTILEWTVKQKEFQAKKKAEVPKAAEAKEGEAKEDEKKEGEAGDAGEAESDIMTIENVCDVGNGEPLFGQFSVEDWTLLTMRYELYLMAQAFMQDAGDAERVGIHETNIAFYYSKYFRKNFVPKAYGREDVKEVLELVKDAVALDEEKKVLKTTTADDVDSPELFVKLTEEARRERQRRIDAGDETARLKFNLALARETPQLQPGAQIRPHGAAAAAVAGLVAAAQAQRGAVAGGAVGQQWRPLAQAQWTPRPNFPGVVPGKGGWGQPSQYAPRQPFVQKWR